MMVSSDRHYYGYFFIPMVLCDIQYNNEITKVKLMMHFTVTIFIFSF